MFAAGFFELIDAARENSLLGAISEGRLLGNHVLFVCVQACLVEIPPAKCVVGLDDFVKALSLGFTLDDGFLGSQIGAHGFQKSIAPTADLWRQTLADDPPQCVRK